MTVMMMMCLNLLLLHNPVLQLLELVQKKVGVVVGVGNALKLYLDVS